MANYEILNPDPGKVFIDQTCASIFTGDYIKAHTVNSKMEFPKFQKFKPNEISCNGIV